MPLTVSVFVVAFQPISPLGAVSHSTVWLVTWLAAAEPLTPRTTVQVVVPKPAVTVMYSLSIRMLNWVVGKPAAELTLTVVALAVNALVSVVFAPVPTRQKYELDGVRSKTVLTLLSRFG